MAEHDLRAMFLGDAPTLRQAASVYGVQADAWIVTMLIYMFSLSSSVLNLETAESLIRTIRAAYGWMKLTEFMYFVFLYRTGEFGKVYGKADGQTVMIALKEFARMRDSKRRDFLATAEAEVDPDKEWNYSSDTTNAIANALQSADFAKYGLWRGEPWATDMAKAFFVRKTLETFPGDMSYDDRRAWALDNGTDMATVLEYEMQFGEN